MAGDEATLLILDVVNNVENLLSIGRATQGDGDNNTVDVLCQAKA